MGIYHKKKVAIDRPDAIDATMIRGISQWNAAHNGPDFLAYMLNSISAVTVNTPVKNQADVEIPNCRGRYDFSFVDSVRLVVGGDYGSARVKMKYSNDLLNWYPLDGASGPYVQQPDNDAVPILQSTAWAALTAGARGDRWIAPFLGQNTIAGVSRISTIWLYVR